MRLEREQIIVLVGTLLIVLGGRSLIIGPDKLGMFSVFFSHAFYEVMGNGYKELRMGIAIFGAAFLWSYFSNKKNLVRIFYCMIIVIIFKWVVDIYSISFIFGDNTEWKFLPFITFMVGFLMVKKNFLVNTY